MDRALNPKLEKETIYEIYRACRLCGAGAGYKMPIMQNVLASEDTELNLTQKIRECVQIEVHQDDKMPPLICELCVDKVNDFYEFLDMCRQTNKRTRLKLGLPLQSASKGVQESGDCILGDTEPVFINSDSDVEPLSKHKSKPKSKERSKDTQHKSRMKKEMEHNINIENIIYTDRRSCRAKPSPPSPQPPPRVTRTSSANETTAKTQESSKRTKTPLKSIIKKEKEDEKVEETPLSTLKRTREREVKTEIPLKKVKLVIEQCNPSKLKSPKTSKSKRPSSPAAAGAAGGDSAEYTCPVCSLTTRTCIGHNNHMRTHVVSFTNAKLACNACGEWFSSFTEAASHHKWHKNTPYKCRRCTAEFQHIEDYDEHFGNKQCVPYDEVPDVRCADCWRHFATDKLLIEHKCAGEDGRPGGKCPKCNRTYVLLKNLIRHESTCLHRKRNEYNFDSELMSQLRPLQVRVARCDPLLNNTIGQHYNVCDVVDFGYDDNCVYPYSKHVRIKKEPFEGMVKINEEIEKDFLSKEIWDSEESDVDHADKLQPLRTLALKRIVTLKKEADKEDAHSGGKDSPSILDSASDEFKLSDSNLSDCAKDINLDSDFTENTRAEKPNVEKEFSIEPSQQRGDETAQSDTIDPVSAKEIDTSNEYGAERLDGDSTSAKETEDVFDGNASHNNDSKQSCNDDTQDGHNLFNGSVKNGAGENGVSNDKYNIEDSEFDSEIDGDKLIAALNAQIGEDDDDEKHKDVKKGDKLSLEELLAKESKGMDMDISKDFNFDV